METKIHTMRVHRCLALVTAASGSRLHDHAKCLEPIFAEPQAGPALLLPHVPRKKRTKPGCDYIFTLGYD